MDAVLAINRDVTERHHAEVALRTLNDSLRSQAGPVSAQTHLSHVVDARMGDSHQRSRS